jgi:hypothetical protein
VLIDRMPNPEPTHTYAKILGTLDKVAKEITDLPTEQRGSAFLFARQKYEAVLRERGVDVECSADRLKIDTIMLKLRRTVAQFESSGRPRVVQKS